jgi:hypothetical protein
MLVVVVVTYRTSTSGSDGGIISVCCSSSEARSFAISFRARSGNSPDRVCAQFYSMRASCALTFSTVFMSSSVSVDMVGFVYMGAVVVVAMAARRSSRLQIFFAAFRQMLSIVFWSVGNQWKGGLTVLDISTVPVLGYGVLWCSGALVLWYSNWFWCSKTGVLSSGYWVLGWDLMLGARKGVRKSLGVESRTHHHMERAQGLSERDQTCRRQGQAGRMDCKQDRTGQPI